MKNLIKKIPDILFDIGTILISVILISSVILVASNVCKFEIVKLPDIQVHKINQEIEKESVNDTIEPTKEDYVKMRNEEIESLKFIESDLVRFIKYKGICYRYEETTGIKEDVSANLKKIFTLEEIYLIQRTIETECYQCDFMSKVNVASVILNRLEHDKFGDTVKEVITTPYQFAYDRRYISYDTVLALEYATHFGDTTNGALFFHSLEKTEKFNNRDYIFTDSSGHHFYGW